MARARLAGLALLLGSAALLAACEAREARGPGEVSPGEARVLEEAAQMLDQRRLPAEALPPEATPAQSPGDSRAAPGQ